MLTHQPDEPQTCDPTFSHLDEAVSALPDLTYTRPAIVDAASYEAAQEFDDTAQLLADAMEHWSSWTLGTRFAGDERRRARYLADCVRQGHVVDLSGGIV